MPEIHHLPKRYGRTTAVDDLTLATPPQRGARAPRAQRSREDHHAVFTSRTLLATLLPLWHGTRHLSTAQH